jgi:hypothetical protein
METAVLNNVDIFVQFGSGVDPYFRLPMFDPPIGWRKVWFFLRNDVDGPFPVFMGSLVSRRASAGRVRRVQRADVKIAGSEWAV